jgi:hypothetical protein
MDTIINTIPPSTKDTINTTGTSALSVGVSAKKATLHTIDHYIGSG